MTDALLSENDRKEALSRAYVAAVAGAAGYCTSSPSDFDRDSIDISFSARGPRRPRLDVQLKATSNLQQVNGIFTFPLTLKNYNDLRAETLVPRALVVLDMPGDESQWLTMTTEELILRRSAYYTVLTGEGEKENTTSVTVRIDPENRFDIEALRGLMDRARTGSL